MRLPISRVTPLVLVVVVALVCGATTQAWSDAGDDPALPMARARSTGDPPSTTCPEFPPGTASADSARGTMSVPVVGLDGANRRYTDAVYGWSVDWLPAAWPSGVWAAVDRDGYPVLNLAGAPPLCNLWEPGYSETEWRHKERYWTVSLRSADAAHPAFGEQAAGASGPADPAGCLLGENGSGLEIVLGADGRPLREVTAERAWEVVQSPLFDSVTYRECRVLLPGVALLAINGEIGAAAYADQAPKLAALLATVQIPAAGVWTPAPVRTAMPTPTPVLRPVSDETLARLTVLNLGEPSIQMQAGESRDLDLGVVECCYFAFPAPVDAAWSVEPAKGATIDPGTGLLTIDPTTPNGSVFAVRADVEDGRRVVTAEVYVYTAEANPLVGHWREEARIICGTGAEVVPDRPVGSLVFRADGTFSVTWQPFELYTDYWGTYHFDVALGTLELVVDGGNYMPPDVDGSGTVSADGAGRLALTDLWLGTPRDGAGPPACGHRFVDPWVAAAEHAAATPDQATATTPAATATPTVAPAAGTPAATDGDACFVVRDRPTFPALVRADGAVAGECGSPTFPDVRAFLAVEAEWTTTSGEERALVTSVELEPGESADFGLVVNVEGGPRAVPLSAGERWSVAGCEPEASPASPVAEPARAAACVVSGRAPSAPAEGAHIDPTTGVLTVDPATPAGRRFAVSATFTVDGVRHERSVEVLVVPGARDSATPAEDPSTLLLRAPVVLPPGPVAVQVARYRFDARSQETLDPWSGSLALVVESGSLEIEVASPALLLPPNAPHDAQGERLVPGQRRSLGPGDQLVVAGPGGLMTWNTGSGVAEVLVVRFGEASEAAGGTPQAAGVTVMVLIDGKLAGGPVGSTSIFLNRVELTPGTSSGPIGIVVGYGFFAAETGTLTMDLTEGAGTVRQGGELRPLAPAAETGPEAILSPGDTALVEPGTWLTLANPGPDRLVGFDLIVRLEPLPGSPDPPGNAEPGATGASSPP